MQFRCSKVHRLVFIPQQHPLNLSSRSRVYCCLPIVSSLCHLIAFQECSCHHWLRVAFEREGIRSLIRARNQHHDEDEYAVSSREITKPSRVSTFLFIQESVQKYGWFQAQLKQLKLKLQLRLPTCLVSLKIFDIGGSNVVVREGNTKPGNVVQKKHQSYHYCKRDNQSNSFTKDYWISRLSLNVDTQNKCNLNS